MKTGKARFRGKNGQTLSCWHSVWFERDVRRIDFVVIFFQWTQKWTALNFEVSFQPLIQLNSRVSQNNSWKWHWVPLFSQEIRTSEDVRDLKKVEVWFYVLSEVSFLTRAKPQERIPWALWGMPWPSKASKNNFKRSRRCSMYLLYVNFLPNTKGVNSIATIFRSPP